MALQRPQWTAQVLAYWFDELEPSDWFRKDDSIDTEIAARFGDLHTHLANAESDVCLIDADTALSAIIVLDQFSRNIFRGTAKSFAFDAKAKSLAGDMIGRGWDQQIDTNKRVFVYLPFEHSEKLADQDRAVELITTLGNETLDQYARAHRAVILKFGRFPHRNDILGRASTPEEERYLATPGSGF